MTPSPEHLAESDAIDFGSLRDEIVLGLPYVQSFGKHDALEAQLDMLEREFAGQSRLKFSHAAITVALRRGINAEVNFERFDTLWREHADFLLETLDTRWLVSACDTFADFSTDKSDAQLSIMASLFANTLKLYETERLVTQPTPHNLERLRRRTPLFDGLTAFMIGGGDMVANLLARIDTATRTEKTISAIIRELVHRTLRHETVYRRLAAYQKRHQWPRYMPAIEVPVPPQPTYSIETVCKRSSPTYILLNDTGRLGGGYHCGTTFVCSALRYELQRRGLTELGWANSEEGFDALLAQCPSRPSLVILNGEGTLHHGSARAGELLRCCSKSKALDMPVAVINSVWQENPEDYCKLLHEADLVHVRESASRTALPEGVEAQVTPDVSILALLKLYREGEFPAPAFDLAVMDNVVGDASKALQDYAWRIDAPFFTMSRGALRQMRRRCMVLEGQTAYPALLQGIHVPSARRWVTGRYHGLIAALCAGRPVCALRSNTWKVEGMLRDASLLDACLLPDDWHVRPPESQERLVEECFAIQADIFEERRCAYLDQAVERIKALFDSLAAIAFS